MPEPVGTYQGVQRSRDTSENLTILQEISQYGSNTDSSAKKESKCHDKRLLVTVKNRTLLEENQEESHVLIV
ncbi:hypothetical protein EEL32_24690 [Brevibacillus laterosporus]|nr:hypothetical protein EEL31_23015 [Brevibacillus laterosporus]TPG74776.1 hypothetical protein EEL32_24690 [Brevibacillus laterosporus]